MLPKTRLYVFALGMCAESVLKRSLSADGYAVVTLVTLVAFPIIFWREWKFGRVAGKDSR